MLTARLHTPYCQARVHRKFRPRRGRPARRMSHPSPQDISRPAQVALSDPVRQALSLGRPVVALESTIITHGMPYPQNLETARAVEDLVRAEGVVPATVAVLEGHLTAGLTSEQLERLARKGPEVHKCSIRDLPYVVGKKLDGATTVAATMHVAHLAGIRVFVTGGIGGVHRGGHTSLDISADLLTAGCVPVLVVCAGAKSVLDIPRTLEVLETHGVCVAAYKTDEFPAFFTPKSGCRAPFRVDTPDEAAQLIYAAVTLGTNAGVILGSCASL